MSGVFTSANIESLPHASIKSWCEAWTQAKAIGTEESTQALYKRITGFTGAKSNRDPATLQASDIARFCDREAKQRSRATANLNVEVLRACFGEAVRHGLLTANPAARAKVLNRAKQ